VSSGLDGQFVSIELDSNVVICFMTNI